MAYTPINWQTGDTITAEKLNKMDNGWSVENTQLFSETVTTVAGDLGNSAKFAYSDWIRDDTIIINFDGTDYTCEKIKINSNIFGYGGTSSEAPDFTEYPFAFLSVRNSGNKLYTQTAGEHTVSASVKSLQTSDDFEAVVESIAPMQKLYTVTIGTTTLREVFNAIASGQIPIVTYNDNMMNTPRYIEIFLYARTYDLTASSILLSDGALTVKNYTATNADSPIEAE